MYTNFINICATYTGLPVIAASDIMDVEFATIIVSARPNDDK